MQFNMNQKNTLRDKAQKKGVDSIIEDLNKFLNQNNNCKDKNKRLLNLAFHPDKTNDPLDKLIAKTINEFSNSNISAGSKKELKTKKILSKAAQIKDKNIEYEKVLTNYWKVVSLNCANKVYHDIRYSGLKKIFHAIFTVASNKLFSQNTISHNPYEQQILKLTKYNNQLHQHISIRKDYNNNNLKQALKSQYDAAKKQLNIT
jgi:hypothetical protein